MKRYESVMLAYLLAHVHALIRRSISGYDQEFQNQNKNRPISIVSSLSVAPSSSSVLLLKSRKISSFTSQMFSLILLSYLFH